MKAVVAAFNQEKALVGAFSVITNLRMDLFEALVVTRHQQLTVYTVTRCDHRQPAPAPPHAPAAAAAAGEQRTQRNLLRRGARHLDTWLQWIHRTAVTSFLIISPPHAALLLYFTHSFCLEMTNGCPMTPVAGPFVCAAHK